MALRMLLAALAHRKSQIAIACLSVALGTALVATAVSLRGTQQTLERELSRYGANLLVLPSPGRSLDETSLTTLDQMMGSGDLESYSPLLSLAANIGERDVGVAGVRFAQARNLHPWWSVKGAWPTDGSSALIGANAALKLGIQPGESFTVRTRRAAVTLRAAGLLGTGGSEENQIFVELQTAQTLAGRPGALSLIEGRAPSRKLASLTRELGSSIPDAEVRTPILVAKAEERLIRRLERLLILVSIVVLGASTLGVLATMTARVLERRREVGLMKALGAAEERVTLLFALEAAAIGVIGGLGGAGLGLLLTTVITLQLSGALLPPSPWAPLIGLGVGLGVSLSASLAPIRRAARTAPAVILRGE
ncbi:MAG TPA: ABC transporter permease [Methylomirabilota bacterium]|nr:ABC transporter permease [Methylomirabilota bacterium]